MMKFSSNRVNVADTFSEKFKWSDTRWKLIRTAQSNRLPKSFIPIWAFQTQVENSQLKQNRFQQMIRLVVRKTPSLPTEEKWQNSLIFLVMPFHLRWMVSHLQQWQKKSSLDFYGINQDVISDRHDDQPGQCKKLVEEKFSKDDYESVISNNDWISDKPIGYSVLNQYRSTILDLHVPQRDWGCNNMPKEAKTLYGNCIWHHHLNEQVYYWCSWILFIGKIFMQTSVEAEYFHFTSNQALFTIKLMTGSQGRLDHTLAVTDQSYASNMNNDCSQTFWHYLKKFRAFWSISWLSRCGIEWMWWA